MEAGRARSRGWRLVCLIAFSLSPKVLHPQRKDPLANHAHIARTRQPACAGMLAGNLYALVFPVFTMLGFPRQPNLGHIHHNPVNTATPTGLCAGRIHRFTATSSGVFIHRTGPPDQQCAG